MKVYEFVRSIAKKDAESRIRKHYSNSKSNEVMTLFNGLIDKIITFDNIKISENESDIDIIVNEYSDAFEDEIQRNIFRSILLHLGNISNENQNNYSLLYNRLYRLLEISNAIVVSKLEESIELEIAIFLKEVFVKDEDLINLDDIVKGILAFSPVFFKYNDSLDPSIFIPLFEFAVKKYPSKFTFKYKLAQLYFVTEDYQKAINIFLDIITNHPTPKKDSLPEDNIKDSLILPSDFCDTTDYICRCYYKLCDYDNALKFANHTIKCLPTIKTKNKDGEEIFIKYMVDNITSYIVRIEINHMNNNLEEVLKDFIDIHYFSQFLSRKGGEDFERAKDIIRTLKKNYNIDEVLEEDFNL